MKKKWLIPLLGIGVLLLIVVAALIPSLLTPKPNVGLANGRLKPCPDKPNCVCSEYGTATAFIEPFSIEGLTNKTWSKVKDAIRELGGTIREESEEYLWAIFKTRFFRFVDDVELRLDEENGVIHVRSASRIGYSDLGVNRERVEAIREFLN